MVFVVQCLPDRLDRPIGDDHTPHRLAVSRGERLARVSCGPLVEPDRSVGVKAGRARRAVGIHAGDDSENLILGRAGGLRRGYPAVEKRCGNKRGQDPGVHRGIALSGSSS